MRIRLGIALAVLGVACAALIAGCGGGSSTNLPNPLVRFINFSPDSNPLDFYFNTTNEAPALTYLSSSADVSLTKFGDQDFSVNDSTTQSELDAVAFTIAKDNKYISMTVGLENFGSDFQKRLQLLAFNYDKNPPNGTQARLLIEHGLMYQPGIQTPNIDFQGGDVSTYDPNNPQFSSPDIPFASNPPVTLLVDAGVAIHFQARRAGTENVLADNPSFTFDSGGIYLAVVSGVNQAVGVQAPAITYIKLNP